MAKQYIKNEDLEYLIGRYLDDLIEVCGHCHIDWHRMRTLLINKWIEAENEKNCRYW